MVIVYIAHCTVTRLTTVTAICVAAEIKDQNKALTSQGKDIPIHQELPTMEDILKLRRSPRNKNTNTTFNFVVEYLAGPVLGQRKWKTERCYKPLSEVMTVSDEAFMLLLLENQYDMWKDAETTRVGRGKYTDNVKNKKFCGWSNDGIRRFNQLFEDVKANRDKQFAKEVEEATVKTLAQRYNKMLAVGVRRKNGHKRRRHGVMVNTDDEEDDEEEEVIVQDQLAMYGIPVVGV